MDFQRSPPAASSARPVLELTRGARRTLQAPAEAPIVAAAPAPVAAAPPRTARPRAGDAVAAPAVRSQARPDWNSDTKTPATFSQTAARVALRPTGPTTEGAPVSGSADTSSYDERRRKQWAAKQRHLAIQRFLAGQDPGPWFRPPRANPPAPSRITPAHRQSAPSSTRIAARSPREATRRSSGPAPSTKPESPLPTKRPTPTSAPAPAPSSTPLVTPRDGRRARRALPVTIDATAIPIGAVVGRAVQPSTHDTDAMTRGGQLITLATDAILPGASTATVGALRVTPAPFSLTRPATRGPGVVVSRHDGDVRRSAAVITDADLTIHMQHWDPAPASSSSLSSSSSDRSTSVHRSGTGSGARSEQQHHHQQQDGMRNVDEDLLLTEHAGGAGSGVDLPLAGGPLQVRQRLDRLAVALQSLDAFEASLLLRLDDTHVPNPSEPHHPPVSSSSSSSSSLLPMPMPANVGVPAEDERPAIRRDVAAAARLPWRSWAPPSAVEGLRDFAARRRRLNWAGSWTHAVPPSPDQDPSLAPPPGIVAAATALADSILSAELQVALASQAEQVVGRLAQAVVDVA